MVQLSGEGIINPSIPQPTFHVVPLPVEFSTITLGGLAERRYRIINDGFSGALRVTAFAVRDGASAGFSVGGFPGDAEATCEAGPGAECELFAAFEPQTYGRADGTIVFSSNVEDTMPSSAHEVPLVEFGVPPALAGRPEADDHTFVQDTPVPDFEFCRVGLLGFDIEVGRFVGDVDAANLLVDPTGLDAAGIVNAQATLRIDAFDANGEAVLFDGQQVGNLDTMPGWSINRFPVDIEKVRFPSRNADRRILGTPGRNRVWVMLGANNPPCTAVAWGALRIHAASPVALIHGAGSSGAFWGRQRFTEGLDTRLVPFDTEIDLRGLIPDQSRRRR